MVSLAQKPENSHWGLRCHPFSSYCTETDASSKSLDPNSRKKDDFQIIKGTNVYFSSFNVLLSPPRDLCTFDDVNKNSLFQLFPFSTGKDKFNFKLVQRLRWFVCVCEREFLKIIHVFL